MRTNAKTLALLLFCASAICLRAPTWTFAWNMNPELDLAGYRFYWRLDNATYTTNNMVPLQGRTNTTVTLTNLTLLGTYSLMVTAVSSNGWESLRSNEITISNAPSPPTGLKVTMSIERSDSISGPWLPEQQLTFITPARSQTGFWRATLGIEP